MAIPRWFRSPRYPLWLLGILLAWFACWCWKPAHPGDFAIEHILTVSFLGLLIWTRRKFPLSNVSYTLIFLFLALHIVGAFYTYSEVPYQRWGEAIGLDIAGLFGFQRNHFDRLVHFAFGLLLAYPAREVFVRIAKARGFWGYYLPLDVMMSLSMVYELLEWGVAVVMAPDIGQSYLGTQGDEWDAHKDMALASLGALLAMITAALINRRYQRDFATEFAESLRADGHGPLGEAALAQGDRPR